MPSRRFQTSRGTWKGWKDLEGGQEGSGSPSIRGEFFHIRKTPGGERVVLSCAVTGRLSIMEGVRECLGWCVEA